LSGRLMSIIDVYDALANSRVYKPAYTHEEALDIIAKERNKHFDPDIVDAFLNIEENIKNINEKLFQQNTRKDNLILISCEDSGYNYERRRF